MENHQKLTFREGVRPWDLARIHGRIESFRFIMESSIFKPYSASYDFLACGKLPVALSPPVDFVGRGGVPYPSHTLPLPRGGVT